MVVCSCNHLLPKVLLLVSHVKVVADSDSTEWLLILPSNFISPLTCFCEPQFEKCSIKALTSTIATACASTHDCPLEIKVKMKIIKKYEVEKKKEKACKCEQNRQMSKGGKRASLLGNLPQFTERR